MRTRRLFSALSAFILLAVTLQAEPVLKPGDILAVCGDSITEQKMYSVFIEDYVIMCQPVKDVKVIQFGWGGDRAPAFAGRMGKYVVGFKPAVVTTCFGMNDGNYAPINEGTEKTYRDGMNALVKNFKEAGVRTIIVGTPGVVDSDTFKRISPDIYNQTLGKLGDIAKEVATAEGLLFADLHNPMMAVMGKAKAAKGNGYAVAGGDGVHPGPNGHLLMAQAFLKALGFDGNIGTITYDASSGKAEATEGHKVTSSKVGEIALESVRYPFCFVGDEKNASFHTTILPFTDFNNELNRYILIVKNFKSPKAKITWGAESKEFTADELSKGINLADQFLKNPFLQQFNEVDKVIRGKQEFETAFIKAYLANAWWYKNFVPQKEATFKTIEDSMKEVQGAMIEQSLKMFKPVAHTIKIEEAK